MTYSIPSTAVEKIQFSDSCWLWTGCTNSNGGYGRVYLSNPKRSQVAHRYIWEQVVGPIPAGMELDHLCRVRNCVNPDHLEPVTRGENMRRGSQKLSEEKIRAILTHPGDGKSTAALLGVSESVVSKYRKRKNLNAK